ncbi:MAG: LuxR C-terminal-related transcriptional regulator [Thermodesulfobacteriaceae bacterium]|nr:LuxR C-terminal-related transcriptional regulator [Thermodesulfobacteriaceae bacterium]MCX8042009.1 LuxR C-terminal-related transcriptional regulator [Thermodesulfobacteriaceae bacterium]MDW8136427.1 LuxR C-terminal-related transcriptional regulator [Thermodesulfobacterium sp.]
MNLKLSVYQAILDSLPTQISIIDEKGNILATNQSWQNQAIKGKIVGRPDCIGYNYLEICEKTEGPERETAQKIAQGIKRVIRGEIPSYKDVYSFIDFEGQERWFLITVAPIQGVKPKIFVVAHEEITSIKILEKKLEEREEKIEEQKKEIEEMQSTLRETLKAKEKEKKELLYTIKSYLENIVDPLIDLVEKSSSQENFSGVFKILKEKLEELKKVTSGEIANPFLNLNLKEAQVALLVKEGYSSKDIARILNLSKPAVDFYRKRIRKKIGLKGAKETLEEFLRKTF